MKKDLSIFLWEIFYLSFLCLMYFLKNKSSGHNLIPILFFVQHAKVFPYHTYKASGGNENSFCYSG